MRNKQSIDRLVEIRRDKSYKCDSDGNEWLPISEFSIARAAILLNHLDQTLPSEYDWIDPDITEDMDGGFDLEWDNSDSEVFLHFWIQVGEPDIVVIRTAIGVQGYPILEKIQTAAATPYLEWFLYSGQ